MKYEYIIIRTILQSKHLPKCLIQETKRYKELIKTPMDLSIVKRKLGSKENERYVHPEGYVADIRLIFINCAKYYKVSVTLQRCSIYLNTSEVTQ